MIDDLRVLYVKPRFEIVVEPVEPSHNSGELRLTFNPGGETEIRFKPIASVSPKDTSEGNIADARNYFDAFTPGMSAEDAMKIVGHKVPDKPKWGSSKDFGYFGKPETVTLEVYVENGVLARVLMRYASDSHGKKVIAEK